MITAKRGRKPKAEAERKSKPVGLRFPAGLLERVEKAQRASGAKSLSDEIVRRLERSFDEDERLTKRFGGEKTYAFLRLVAVVLGDLRRMTGHAWHEDPYTFDHAREAIADVFAEFRPEGPATPPDDMPVIKAFLAARHTDASAREQVKTLALGKILARDRLYDIHRHVDGDNREFDRDPSFQVADIMKTIAPYLKPLVKRASGSPSGRLYKSMKGSSRK